MWCLAVESPACAVDPQSATGSQEVTFTCSVEICGSASIPVNIIKSGATVESGKNTVTWQTTADDVSGTDVKCSADFGDPATCPAVNTTSGKSPVRSSLQPAGTNDVTLRHYKRSRSWPRLSFNISKSIMIECRFQWSTHRGNRI